MLLLPLLTLLAGLAPTAPAGPAPARVKFMGADLELPAGCRAEAESTEEHTVVTCGRADFLLWWLLPTPAAALREQADRTRQEALASAGTVGSKKDSVPCWVQGFEATCGRVRADVREGGKRIYLDAVVDLGKRRLLVLCAAPGDSGAAPPCSTLLAMAAPPPVSFMGRPVKVPPACRADRLPNGGVVRCGEEQWPVTWGSAPGEKEARELYAGLERDARSDGQAFPSFQATPVACKLGGAAGTCLRFRMSNLQDVKLSRVIGQAAIGGQHVVAMCQAPASDARAFPCPLVFDLK